MTMLVLLTLCTVVAVPIVRYSRPGPHVWPTRRSWFDIPHE